MVSSTIETKRKVHKTKNIICERSCFQCQYLNPDKSCKKILAAKRNAQDIILIEPRKSLIYFTTKKIISGLPPWVSQEWERVYVNNPTIIELKDIIKMYNVGPYISIFYSTTDGQISYRAIPHVKTPLEFEILERMKKYTIKDDDDDIIRPLTRRINKRKEKVMSMINEVFPEIPIHTKQKIVDLISYQCVIETIFPLILDENVEDIYLDKPGTHIYFDHRILGRCIGATRIQQNDAIKIITFLRVESNYHLDRLNPSLKTEVLVDDIRLRFSATIQPLSPDGLHLEIRRARRFPFTLYELIQNNTLTIESAALLLLGFVSRFNITITGEPGTGKTTLLNALDMCTPKTWRKIYIEDAIESRVQKDQHQIRFRVAPIDETHTHSSKIEEITKTLHRSPDYLILGEIQTADHSKALFQALMAGLRSTQTCHSSSAAGLISRWKFSHGIKEHEIALMDLVVVLHRPEPGKSQRLVKEIVEIRREVKRGLLWFKGLNTIYRANQPIEDWFQDGAIISRFRELGINDPSERFQRVVKTISSHLNENIESHLTIGELLLEQKIIS